MFVAATAGVLSDFVCVACSITSRHRLLTASRTDGWAVIKG